MSKGKDLFQFLTDESLLGYGQIIPAELVQKQLGITYPKTGTRKRFQELTLQELAAIDYVKSALLIQGKAMVQSKGNYRVLLPSENQDQIERYMSSADRKLRRALTLVKNTPYVESFNADEATVKIMLKRESLRKELERQRSIK